MWSQGSTEPAHSRRASSISIEEYCKFQNSKGNSESVSPRDNSIDACSKTLIRRRAKDHLDAQIFNENTSKSIFRGKLVRSILPYTVSRISILTKTREKVLNLPYRYLAALNIYRDTRGLLRSRQLSWTWRRCSLMSVQADKQRDMACCHFASSIE